jgi:hypothetical protein
METRLLRRMTDNDSVVYWARTGVDGYGSDLFAQPVEATARWDDRMQEVTDAQGERTLAKSQFMSQSITPRPGDMIFHGTLDELETLMVGLSGTVDNHPALCPSAEVIITVSRAPTFRGDEHLMQAYL